MQLVDGPLRMPRRFKRHLGPLHGAAFRAHYTQLSDAYGPFTHPLVAEAAADCAQAHVLKLAASMAWEEAQMMRETGRGRRPRRSQVITLSKRVNLAAASYQHAFDRLHTLLTATQPDLARQIQEAQRRARQHA
jgi:hypothetical protein